LGPRLEEKWEKIVKSEHIEFLLLEQSNLRSYFLDVNLELGKGGNARKESAEIGCAFKQGGIVVEHNVHALTPDGFCRTGDVVRIKPDGNFSVEGRVKDMMNRGGEKNSAEEAENLILGHPAVQNVAVVAMPDKVTGERVCAYVIPRPGGAPTLEALRQFMDRAGISKFKLPEWLEVVERFPLTAVGRISEKDLRENIAAKLRAEGKIV